MAITIQYTDGGEEKIIGSNGQESENITIQWRQHEIDADVLKRIQRDPRVFTRSRIIPEEVEGETSNFTGTININGSALFTFSDDTALLSFTITNPEGENYTVNDSKISWIINGSELGVKNNVYELSESELVDREVNVIKVIYDDGEVRATDDITILKYIGYDETSIGDGGVDPEDDPNIVGGVVEDSSLIDTVAPNGFETNKKIQFYWKGKDTPFILWRVDGTDELKQKFFEWIPQSTGVYIVKAIPIDFKSDEDEPAQETIKIVRNQSGFSGGSGGTGGGRNREDREVRNNQLRIR